MNVVLMMQSLKCYSRLRFYISALLAGLLICSAEVQADPDFAVAWQDLKTLSDDQMAGRAMGSSGSKLAQDFIASRFKALGLQPLAADYRQTFVHNFALSKPQTGVNLVGVRLGCTYPEHFMVITAHYDHLPVQGRQVFNGADDNASGVAGLLYLAKKSGEQCPAYSQIFLATDGEERGLFGAKAFLATWPKPQQLVINLNLDMISRGEKSAKLYLAGKKTFPQLDVFAQQIETQNFAIKLLLAHDHRSLNRSGRSQHNLIDWPNASDHAVFRKAGIPYLYFGVDTHQHYHTVDDDWQRINKPFFQQALTIIALGWRFADAQPLMELQSLRRSE